MWGGERGEGRGVGVCVRGGCVGVKGGVSW